MADRFSEETIAELRKPVDNRRVVTGQSGPLRGVKYLEAFDVIERANELFGYAGWSFRVIGQPWCAEQGVQGEKQTPYEVWCAVAEVTVAGATYSDVGTNTRQGLGSNSLEMAIKGAVSDAVKRCLRFLGNQFGLSLYDKDDPYDLREQNKRPAPEQAPAAHPGVNGVMSIVAKGAPSGTRGADVKEATAMALGARPSELNKEIMRDFIDAWLRQPGNTTHAFEVKFHAALDELRSREAAPA